MKVGDKVRSTIRGWFGTVLEIKDNHALVIWDGIGTENWISIQYIRRSDRTRPDCDCL